ncbi:FAD-dependent pyridine nucleotide-disulphide oxidoreductase [Methylobacterium sp. 4-46]|uniref:NAD(P)/FAD-dependent oxidoreductase n=1 Tax=unclassified Methylobacterium TaxID=2615210 RepID=UPI000165CBE0|nr:MULTISPECIES: FAD-dependent oxidoreductase [Methylobacterium]ACA19962.1 FAD-dependent pyridine nucleotide-disulphide oxidoreductase [Methylobacterium sp. 4-46]WFT79146.1 FAD-dependent oxidoreductase [Methylobacterium nodulans]
MAKRILVVGGGFAGLWSAAAAARARDALGLSGQVAVTLVAPDPFHVIRVRCYEADLAPLAVPLDDVLGPVDVDRIEGTVTGIDAVARRLVVQPRGGPGPFTLAYDRLILAPGSVLTRPQVPGIDAALSIDTLAGARQLARHLDGLGRGAGRDRTGRWTAVVVGGGLVGLELACELPARLAAARDRAGEAGPVRTVLVDRSAEVGSAMGGAAMPAIRQALAAAGVESVVGGVAAVDAAGVTLGDATAIPALTVVCATGMRASPLAGELGVPRDDLGRLPVDALMRVIGVPAVFAAGDVAVADADDAGHRTVMSCQHARPMGRFAGHNAVCDLAERPDLCRPFAAPDYVTVLDLGEWGAVYTAGWDRERLMAEGAAAKAIKRTINGSRIYPPLSRDRAAILAAAAPIIQARPATAA